MAQSSFYKIYSGSQFNSVRDVVKTYDNGFAFVTFQGFIMKIDNNMEVDFCKKFEHDSASHFFFKNIIQTTDSGYIINTLYDPSNSNTLGYIIKFDKDGIYLWSKRLYHPTSPSNSSWDMISGENNEFYMLTQGCLGGAILVKCDIIGNIIWQKGFYHAQSCTKIIKHSDDKFLILGSRFISDSVRVVQVLSCDTSGNLLWFKEFNNNKDNFSIMDVAEASNGNLSIIANSKISNNYYVQLLILLDSAGQLLSAKKMEILNSNYYTFINSITTTIDNGYIYLGNHSIPGIQRVIYFKTDSMNNLQWARMFEDKTIYGTIVGEKIHNVNNDIYIIGNNPPSVIKLNDNYLFCKKTFSVQLIYEDISVNMTEMSLATYITGYQANDNSFSYKNLYKSSFLICNEVSATNNYDITSSIFCFPNPTSDYVNIKGDELSGVEIFNTKGQLIKNIDMNFENDFKVDLTNFDKGLYIFKIKTRQGNTYKKLVLQ